MKHQNKANKKVLLRKFSDGYDEEEDEGSCGNKIQR